MSKSLQRRAPRVASRRSGGFTLLELLLAFVVFALSFATVLEILSGSMRNTVRAREYTEAALTAQSVMDQVGLEIPLEAGFTASGESGDYHWEIDIFGYEGGEAVQAALRAGAPVNVVYTDGTTPLGLAVEARDARSASLLLEAGATPERAERGGRTPLLIAARQGDVASARALLAKGASVGARGPGGRTALMIAAQRSDLSLARVLLAAGADPGLRDEHGDAAAALAAGPNAAALGKLLAARGGSRPPARADRGAASPPRLAKELPPGYPGWTRLGVAAWLGHGDDVASLLASGAAVDALDTRGRSPLLLAAERGHDPIVAALLRAGAAPLSLTRRVNRGKSGSCAT